MMGKYKRMKLYTLSVGSLEKIQENTIQQKEYDYLLLYTAYWVKTIVPLTISTNLEQPSMAL